MKKHIVSLAAGSAFVASAVLAPVVNAADNPFSGARLEGGYQLAQADTKTKDAKCGGDKGREAKLGGEKAKDAKCGADKAKEARDGGDKKKEGKCGEAKCGADKKK